MNCRATHRGTYRIRKAFTVLFLLLFAHTPAYASSADELKSTSRGVNVVAKHNQQSHEIRSAVESIVHLVTDMPIKSPVVVRVPAYNYAAILQELQKRNAKFLLPGAAAPELAKVVFQLQADEVGLSQMVYLVD